MLAPFLIYINFILFIYSFIKYKCLTGLALKNIFIYFFFYLFIKIVVSVPIEASLFPNSIFF